MTIPRHKHAKRRTAVRRCFSIPLIFILTFAAASAQLDSIRTNIGRIINAADGTVGVALRVIETGDTLSWNGHGRVPMQSVYKFPVALAVLAQVDRGILSLHQRVHVKKEELRPDTWSPLREKYPEGNVDIPLSELVAVTVSQSDNNGCDILIRLVGGTTAVQTYLHDFGISDVAVAATEEEMQRNGEEQFRNWCTPVAMRELLTVWYRDSILSPGSSSFFRQCMIATSTGPRRLKGLLPTGTEVAHKTGSSGTDDKGVAAATNDVGIISLPDGRHVVLAVFLTDSRADEPARDHVIARIAKSVWDGFTKQE